MTGQENKTMAQTVADVLLARLPEWNTRPVFAFPGDRINGLLAAWGRVGNDPSSCRPGMRRWRRSCS
jgi:thiamine pyrophosphate-dependent acetolactate synthase large subunit-like protein